MFLANKVTSPAWTRSWCVPCNSKSSLFSSTFV